MECAKSNPPCPLQNLNFELVEVKENMTLLGFKHIFREAVQFDHIKNLKNHKVKILSRLRREIELKKDFYK